MEIKKTLFLALFVLSLPAAGAAQTAEEVNEANNPLTPKITVNLQNQYVGSYYGLSDSDSNSVLVRGVLPHRLSGCRRYCALPYRSSHHRTRARQRVWATSICSISFCSKLEE
jgi:hypothetical protein